MITRRRHFKQLAVLACFRPQWPGLKVTLAQFEFTPSTTGWEIA
jgi:hypothetical protein